MNTVKASVILNDAQRLMRWDTAQLEETEKADLMQVAFSKALQEVWEEWWWEELMTCERMALRDPYASATAYAAGDEVYFPATRTYYQALTATTGNAPAVLGDSGDYEVNADYWIEAALTRTADDFETRAYEYGELARNPEDDLIYARIVNTLTLTGAGAAYLAALPVYSKQAAGSYNVSVLPSDTNALTADEDSWINGDPMTSPYVASIRHNPTANLWVLAKETLFAVVFGTSETLVGDYSTAYQNTANTPAGTVAWTAADAPPSANWGVVNEFDPTLETSRTVRMVARLDPRNTHNPGPYDFDRTPDGIRLEEIPERSPFVWARRVTPIIADDCAEFSATATYAATPAELLVFDA